MLLQSAAFCVLLRVETMQEEYPLRPYFSQNVLRDSVCAACSMFVSPSCEQCVVLQFDESHDEFCFHSMFAKTTSLACSLRPLPSVRGQGLARAKRSLGPGEAVLW